MFSEIYKLYRVRFKEDIRGKRVRIWRVLVQRYFQNFVKPTDVIIDLACGYCEFINHIEAKKKIAIDINPDTKKYAHKDVTVMTVSSTNLPKQLTGKADKVFVSNFFEHLASKNEVLRTLREVKRVLKRHGQILILHPNIRYLYSEYWDFLDHQLAMSEKALVEALELLDFKIVLVIPKFLPYTTKTRWPTNNWLILIYLKFPWLWKVFGKQSFIVAQKK